MNSVVTSEAFLVAIVGLIGGAIGYLLKVLADSKTRRLDRNLAIHVEMMGAIGELASAHLSNFSMKEAQHSFAVAKLKFSVVASDDAIRALGKLNKVFSGAGEKSAQEINKCVADFMRTARNDVHAGTYLSDSELLGASPFVVVAKGDE